MSEYILQHTGDELDSAIDKVHNGYIDPGDASRDVEPSDVTSGKSVYDGNGNLIEGTGAYEKFDFSDADTANLSGVILDGYKFYAQDYDDEANIVGNGDGVLVEGTMTAVGEVTHILSAQENWQYTIPEGYHNGNGNVYLPEEYTDELSGENILKGHTIMGVDGTYEYDFSDASLIDPKYVLSGIAYYDSQGELKTGTMPNNGEISKELSEEDSSTGTATGQWSYTIPRGYHNGNGSVYLPANHTAQLLSANIRNGAYIMGVFGSYEGKSFDFSDASTIDPGYVLSGYSYYDVEETLKTGEMTDNGAVSKSLSQDDSTTGEATGQWTYAIPKGYHNGSGSVYLPEEYTSNLTADNIANGASIMGLVGSFSDFTQYQEGIFTPSSNLAGVSSLASASSGNTISLDFEPKLFIMMESNYNDSSIATGTYNFYVGGFYINSRMFSYRKSAYLMTTGTVRVSNDNRGWLADGSTMYYYDTSTTYRMASGVPFVWYAFG